MQAAQNLDGDGAGLGGDLSSLVQSLQDVDAPTLSLSPVRSCGAQFTGHVARNVDPDQSDAWVL